MFRAGRGDAIRRSETKGVNLGGFVPFSGGNLGVKQTVSDVSIDWRFVDAYNRKVIKSGRITASKKGTSFDVGVGVNGNGGNIGFGNQEFMNSAVGKAAAEAVTNLTRNCRGSRCRSPGDVWPGGGGQKAHGRVAGKVLYAVVNKNVLIVSLKGQARL